MDGGDPMKYEIKVSGRYLICMLKEPVEVDLQAGEIVEVPDVFGEVRIERIRADAPTAGADAVDRKAERVVQREVRKSNQGRAAGA